MSPIRLSLACLPLLLPMASIAQTTAPATPPGNTPAPPGRSQPLSTMRQAPSGEDFTFARKASEDNAKEIALGKIATDNGHSDATRQFGQRLVQDHSKANQQLKALAQRKGLDLSPPSPKQGKTAQKFRQMQGADFDRAFADYMVKDHKKGIELYRKEASQGRDADLQAYARDTLPVLETHLQNAQSLQNQNVGH